MTDPTEQGSALPPRHDDPAMQEWMPHHLKGYDMVARLAPNSRMSIVCLVRDREKGQLEILKMPFEPRTSTNSRERLEREYRMLRRCQHAYIPRLQSPLRIDELGIPYFTMSYVEGDKLSDWVETRKLRRSDQLRLMSELCEAVAAVHKAGVIHRDIKPDNVIIDRDGHIALIDFGLAKPLTGEASVTEPGWRPGTPHYMAPEQGSDLEGSHTDVFALGAVLYWLLGRQVLPEPSSEGSLGRRIDRRLLSKGVGPWLIRTVRKCVDERHEHRFVDAAELLAALQRFIRVRPYLWLLDLALLVLLVLLGLELSGYGLLS